MITEVPGPLRYMTPNHRYVRRPVYLPKLRKVCHISKNVVEVYMTCFKYILKVTLYVIGSMYSSLFLLIEVKECLLLFGPQPFVFQFVIQKYKD
jgi:hypothetical protein